jgi:hypothetical protein
VVLGPWRHHEYLVSLSRPRRVTHKPQPRHHEVYDRVCTDLYTLACVLMLLYLSLTVSSC